GDDDLGDLEATLVSATHVRSQPGLGPAAVHPGPRASDRPGSRSRSSARDDDRPVQSALSVPASRSLAIDARTTSTESWYFASIEPFSASSTDWKAVMHSGHFLPSSILAASQAIETRASASRTLNALAISLAFLTSPAPRR